MFSRLGFGAGRITGDENWGQPPDRDEVLAVLRRGLELGVTLIDTAASYGPYWALLAGVLHLQVFNGQHGIPTLIA